MKTYYAIGTIGDAYVILCKLYSVAMKEKILCRHYTAYEELRPVIKDIYSLIPNISVEFISERSLDIDLRGAFRYQGQEREQNRYNLKSEYYPEFELGNIDRFNLPEAYETLQIKAGTHGRNRSLRIEIIKGILNNSKLPIILIGENTMSLTAEGFNATDLRGKSSIKEVINIIKNSKHFYGRHGFLSFVAASQKVPSDIHIECQTDVIGVNARMEAVEEWRRFLIRR